MVIKGGSCLALRGCDSGVSDNIKASSTGAIAGKPAPTPTGERGFALRFYCGSAFDLDLRRPARAERIAAIPDQERSNTQKTKGPALRGLLQGRQSLQLAGLIPWDIPNINSKS